MTTEQGTVMEITKIKQLAVGERAYVVGEFTSKTKPQKYGKFYQLVTIVDNTGMASQMVWDNLEINATLADFKDGDYVQADVLCTDYGEYINIEIKHIKKIERKAESNIVDIEGLKEELRQELRNIKDNDLKTLCVNVFNRPDVKEGFFIAPASQTSGYSFEGGLLAHVVRGIRLGKVVSAMFSTWNHNIDNVHSKLNEDLLTTAFIFHDLGNVLSLRRNGFKVEKTFEGEMFTTSYLSMRILNEELAKISLPDEQRILLEHIIGSYKGNTNHGAVFIPRSREAMVFHLIENIDVQMATFEQLDRQASPTDEFVQLFQKTLYLGTFDQE